MVFKRRSALAKLRNSQANYSISTVHHRDKEKETVRSSVVSASVAREVLGLKSQWGLGLSLIARLIKVTLQTACASQNKTIRFSK